MIYTVSENVQIVLDGQKYLLEAGDKIVLETLDTADRSKLASRFNPVDGVESYWKTLDEAEKIMRKRIGFGKKKMREDVSPRQIKLIERHIKDILEFLDNDIGDFVMSLADRKTQELINQDKINRTDKSSHQQTLRDIANTLDISKREHEKELIDAFGESPRQAVERMRKEKKEKEDKLFESILYLENFLEDQK